MQVSALQQLVAQLTSSAPHHPVHVEAAGLVAAVDGSRCLLVMPDSWWWLLRQLNSYDRLQGSKGAWGAAAAAADPVLVHARFCFNHSGVGRMQSLLPLLAAHPRLLLPPTLLAGSSYGNSGGDEGGGLRNDLQSVCGYGGQRDVAAAAAAVLNEELMSTAGLASEEKKQEVRAVVRLD